MTDRPPHVPRPYRPADVPPEAARPSSFTGILLSDLRWRWRHRRRGLIADTGTVLLAGIAGGFAGVAALLEVAAHVPFPARLYFAVGGIVAAFAAVLVALHPTRRRVFATAAGLGALGLVFALLYLVPWSSRKPFLRDLGRIEIGMTQGEVEEIMAGYIRGTGWPASPAGTRPEAGFLADVSSGARYATEPTAGGELAFRDSFVFRHSDDGAFNSDWGVVRFHDGRVAAVEFLPD